MYVAFVYLNVAAASQLVRRCFSVGSLKRNVRGRVGRLPEVVNSAKPEVNTF